VDYERAIEIEAPPAKVWAAMVDVESWPLWTESMTKVERVVRGRPFGLETEAVIEQPKMAPLTWRVVEFEPGVGFAWQSLYRGVTTLAVHSIEPAGDGRSRVRLGVRQSGGMAWLAGLVAGRRIRRNVDLEAEGLKRFVEGG
jgi:hypothetical protein